MRIFLINPPAPDGVMVVREGRCMQRKGAWTAVWSPLSLAICAAVLEQEGIEVSIIDCIVKGVTPKQLILQIAAFKPDLVVLNTSTPSIEADLKMVFMIKQACPETKTAIIGIHPTALPDECFRVCARGAASAGNAISNDLDYIIRGEPEFTLQELCRAIACERDNISGTGSASARGASSQANLQAVQGLSFCEKDKIIHNSSRPWLDLDDLPFPAWHLIDISDYIMPFHNVPFLLVATSRGCPYPCTFCADSTYYGKALRKRSPQRLVDELVFLQERFNVHEFLFWSESFTLDTRFVMAVCAEIIGRGLQISWVCNSRVDHVNLEMLTALKKAGCWMIGYGVESGSQAVLNSVKKGTTVEQTRKAVELSHQAGLEVSGHCILGLPTDTPQTIKQTIEFTIDLDLDFVQFYCAVPFPGSEMYEQACHNRWINTTDWSMFEQNFSVVDYPQLTAKEIMNLRRFAYRRFYLRPRMMLKVWKRLKKASDFKTFFQMVREFLTWI
ncbi:B12-binding domain-containing radical SAM protein [bacterium]|nr:B12-binding domain-containing radical SAM protein [bacterium]MBU1753005.1 B12-binding domain-containing radical SAM protein [bacterium]